jgi:hypothetical protein
MHIYDPKILFIIGKKNVSPHHEMAPYFNVKKCVLNKCLV